MTVLDVNAKTWGPMTHPTYDSPVFLESLLLLFKFGAEFTRVFFTTKVQSSLPIYKLHPRKLRFGSPKFGGLEDDFPVPC